MSTFAEKLAKESSIGALSLVVQPDLSVIVIVYNDADHLAGAVRSVLDQTLGNLEVIISDDHSNDHTPEVAEQLRQADPRVSYHRRERNSGGCGAPRNDGIDLARGRYVMFLDSDDVLEKHACKNLVLAADATDVEIAAGQMVRVFLDGSQKPHKWYPWLYSERKSAKSINEMPMQLHDTAATNKIYRKDLFLRTGIKFNEDIHYEELVFSAQTLSAARGICVIPETIYYWNVYPIEARKSISNQRDSAKNLRDRLFAVKLADEIYSDCDSAVRTEQASKTLRHHIRLYLNDIELAEDEWATTILDVLRPYLCEVKVESFKRLTVWEQALYTSAYAGDILAIRQLLRAAKDGSLSGAIFEESGSMFWAPRGRKSRPDSDEFARQLSQIPANQVAPIDHRNLKYSHRLTAWEKNGSDIVVHGESTDPIGALGQPDSVLNLELSVMGSKEATRSLIQVKPIGSGISWTCVLPSPARRGLRDRNGRELRIVSVDHRGARNTGRVRVEAECMPLISDGSLHAKLLGDRWAFVNPRNEIGVMEISATLRGRIIRRALRTVRPAYAAPLGALRRLRTQVRPMGRIGLGVVYPLMRLIPLRGNQGLFESQMGKSASDNPRAIFEEMMSQVPRLRPIWVSDGGDQVSKDLPETRTVRRDSYGYLYALARSKFLIDNQSFPRYFVKRRTQRYLQTWHGIPLKKMGKDLRNRNRASEDARLNEHVRKWDGLNVASPYFERVFIPAFGFRGTQIKYGSPRLDSLVNGKINATSAKNRLGIPVGKRVVLFAPTFRPRNGRGRAVDFPIDLKQWESKYGSDVVLLVRSHYLNVFRLPKQDAIQCIDVSTHSDINELYAVSDVLVTDYSSVMFDFAVLDRPIVIFAPDYEAYAFGNPGTYFDLRKTPPGAFVQSNDALFEAIDDAFEAGKAGPELAEFRGLYVGDEDGLASRRSVAFLLGKEK